jgi:hypothetical protein
MEATVTVLRATETIPSKSESVGPTQAPLGGGLAFVGTARFDVLVRDILGNGEPGAVTQLCPRMRRGELRLRSGGLAAAPRPVPFLSARSTRTLRIRTVAGNPECPLCRLIGPTASDDGRSVGQDYGRIEGSSRNHLRDYERLDLSRTVFLQVLEGDCRNPATRS